jgi:hypothetical protein
MWSCEMRRLVIDVVDFKERFVEARAMQSEGRGEGRAEGC